MSEFDYLEWATGHFPSLLRSALLLFVGLPLLKALSKMLRRLVQKGISQHAAMIASNALFYGGAALILVMALRELGFKLTALLGAAGVAGVAIGFAAQTSLSNLISGLFLLAEKPFKVGDVLQVGGTTGLVHGMNPLSVTLRTFDNKFVRIPNEYLVKNEFTNVTAFPIRRYDVTVGVAYKEDIARVIEVLRDVADRNPNCLDEPAPLVAFTGFGDSSLNLLLGVWFAKEDFLELRNSIHRDIKERFDREGIEIPFPHRTLYAGSVTDPFPVRLVDAPAPQPPPA